MLDVIKLLFIQHFTTYLFKEKNTTQPKQYKLDLVTNYIWQWETNIQQGCENHVGNLYINDLFLCISHNY